TFRLQRTPDGGEFQCIEIALHKPLPSARRHPLPLRGEAKRATAESAIFTQFAPAFKKSRGKRNSRSTPCPSRVIGDILGRHGMATPFTARKGSANPSISQPFFAGTITERMY
ncbi:MAG TPA: hypothetical protein VJ985_09775, partial [Gammaproteobacteria bacterium]|nr:hypothetical protein [Gammaproteobacteria bacterium]